ncbi:MAG: hypothetical protein NZ601_01655 [candidate division WOR-3 bacterium]|nr:hypothetical protein [candidate division WOR-3 bacterium]MCX7757025.1 hypothetical protein [candidate division WOR-3 bacterium]MDW7987329.1 hypothetical protein [candidate division WOR-3 bacterium]
MKIRLPLILVLITGILGALPFIIPHKIAQDFDNEFRNSVLRIIAAFSLVLGVGSIIKHHTYKIQRRKENWEYSWILIVSLVITSIIGLFGGIEGDGVLPTRIGNFSFDIQTIYMYMAIPLGATMFAMLSFFMASAAYRAFRARNFEATLLLIAAFVMMLGSVPLSTYILPRLPDFAEWILTVPNTAAKRGMGFGIALGSLATSLKIILGIERGWLGGTK